MDARTTATSTTTDFYPDPNRNTDPKPKPNPSTNTNPASIDTSTPHTFFQPQSVRHDDIDSLKSKIIHIKCDNEKKASIQYVDDALRTKVDKSDVVAKTLAHVSSNQREVVSQLQRDVAETKSRCEQLHRNTVDLHDELKQHSNIGVMKGFRTQIDDIYESISQCYTKEQVRALLDQKQAKSEISVLIQPKAGTLPYGYYIPV